MEKYIILCICVYKFQDIKLYMRRIKKIIVSIANFKDEQKNIDFYLKQKMLK